MAIEIKWEDEHPRTGERRYLCADRFGGVWRFRYRLKRREPWRRLRQPTRAMWEYVLDGLERRYRRREGVSDRDLAEVKQLLANWREAAPEAQEMQQEGEPDETDEGTEPT
jgi:hypothetical protein